MANKSYGKLPLETNWSNADQISNGILNRYSGSTGFGYAPSPSTYTIDLGELITIQIIRFLLWDNLGEPELNRSRDGRQYCYVLKTSKDGVKWKSLFDTGDTGFNGWQLFSFRYQEIARFVQVDFFKTTAGDGNIHLVEFEVHDSATMPSIEPATVVLSRTIKGPLLDAESLETFIEDTFNRKFESLDQKSENIIESARKDAKGVTRIKENLEGLVSEFTVATNQLKQISKSLKFHEEASTNHSNSILWLAATIAAFGTLVWVICAFLHDTNYHYVGIAQKVGTELVKQPLLQHQTLIFEFTSFLAAKVILISLLTYLVTFCSKNYKAQRHNYTVNKHKALSLSSSIEFLANEKLSEPTREQILIQGANAIFSHQQSGYSEKDETSPNVVNSIIEKARES